MTAGRRLALFLGFAAAAGLAALARLPATWLDAAVDAASGHRLRLAEADGTVWAGRGVLIAPQLVQPVLGRLSWRVGSDVGRGAWLALYLGQGAAGNEALGLVGAGPKGIVVDDLSLHLAAEPLLGAALADFAVVRWRGRFDVDIRQWRCSWSARKAGLAACKGEGSLVWAGLGSDLLPSVQGDYRALVSVEGDALPIRLSTLAGAPKISAEGRWTQAQGLSLSGSIQLEKAQAKQLATFKNLPLVLQERPDGWHFELKLAPGA